MPAHIYTVEDARRLARRRLPRLMFDFIDGAAGDEAASERNQTAVNDILLMPRVLVNVNERCLKTRILGKEWGLPVGIAPMGMCDLAWPGTDRMLAETAVSHNIPLCLSTMSSTSLEEMRQLADDNVWFQLYVAQSEAQAMTLVDRADAAGYEVLILTVDVPAPAPRPRDLHNGFQVPFRIGVRQFIDFALHPRWSLTSLVQGPPKPANVAVTGKAGFRRDLDRGGIDWHFLDRLRQRWRGTLLVKGVLNPADAKRIQQAGVDGIYISNHGGRQLASAPAAITMLPHIRQAVGEDYPLLFDGGIRNGEGVVKALALGADFVLMGRPFLYGAGAAGQQGVDIITTLIRNEISVTMAQIGKTRVGDIDESVIHKPVS